MRKRFERESMTRGESGVDKYSFRSTVKQGGGVDLSLGYLSNELRIEDYRGHLLIHKRGNSD